MQVAKSKARADRWDEEVQLVTEEMRRCLLFWIGRQAGGTGKGRHS
jgi:hypothetical protein